MALKTVARPQSWVLGDVVRSNNYIYRFLRYNQSGGTFVGIRLYSTFEEDKLYIEVPDVCIVPFRKIPMGKDI